MELVPLQAGGHRAFDPDGRAGKPEDDICGAVALSWLAQHKWRRVLVPAKAGTQVPPPLRLLSSVGARDPQRLQRTKIIPAARRARKLGPSRSNHAWAAGASWALAEEREQRTGTRHQRIRAVSAASDQRTLALPRAG
jgi:hypothetical protein